MYKRDTVPPHVRDMLTKLWPTAEDRRRAAALIQALEKIHAGEENCLNSFSFIRWLKKP